MVKYLMVNFVQEETQKNMMRVFAVIGGEFYFNKFLLNNGLVAWKIQEVDIRLWWATPKDKKQYILTGKESLT